MQAKTPAAYALNIRRLGISLTQFAGFTLSEVCQSTNRPDVHANPPSITPNAHAIDTARWHQILGFEARLHCLLRGCFVKHARTKESGYQDWTPVNTTPGPSQTRNTKPHWHPVRRVRVLDEVRELQFLFSGSRSCNRFQFIRHKPPQTKTKHRNDDCLLFTFGDFKVTCIYSQKIITMTWPAVTFAILCRDAMSMQATSP